MYIDNFLISHVLCVYHSPNEDFCWFVSQGTLKPWIIDFGMGLAQEDTTSSIPLYRDIKPQTVKSFLRRNRHVPPEAVTFKKVSKKTDMYGLGNMLEKLSNHVIQDKEVMKVAEMMKQPYWSERADWEELAKIMDDIVTKDKEEEGD